MLDFVSSGSGAGGTPCPWVALEAGPLSPCSDTVVKEKFRFYFKGFSQFAFETFRPTYSLVDELHVDVDGPHAGEEEGKADGGVVKEFPVQGSERVLRLLGLGELHESPVLRSASFQRNLSSRTGRGKKKKTKQNKTDIRKRRI